MNINNLNLVFEKYDIVAYDDLGGEPFRFYLAKSGIQMNELTKVILVDVFRSEVYEPQMIGSYLKFCCPIKIIDQIENDKRKIWSEIEKISDKTKFKLLEIMNESRQDKNTLNVSRGMKISDFGNFIREIPYEYQAFDIKYSLWSGLTQSNLINGIFQDRDEEGIITISRFDLFKSVINLPAFVIKVLMWGYPTKGRGKNIEKFLENDNFDLFISKLQSFENKISISVSELKELLKFKGLKLSTLSKVLYFKRMKIENFPAMILDQKVINALVSGKFCDEGLERFNGLKYENAINYYIDYLRFINELGQEMGADADRIELFLFEFGSNLKKPNDE